MINKNFIEIEEQKTLMLEIMDDIDAFCRENHIPYFLLGGSLIGAIRHEGYIPWDDDIDIAMLREDYNRFISLYSSKKSSRFKLLSLESDESYAYPFAKVIDVRTKLEEAVDSPDNLGIYVDVFPLDNCPASYDAACKFQKQVGILGGIRNIKAILIDKKRSVWKNVLLFLAKGIVRCVSKRTMSELIAKKVQKYNGLEAEYVAQLSGNVYGTKEIWKKEWFEDIIDVKFEERYYMVPKEYHKVLMTTFGNYMQMPPEEKRVSHHAYVAYWRE